MIAGATLYGFSTSSHLIPFPDTNFEHGYTGNATEEFFVRKRPLYEVIGQMGLWGFLINGIQASALEHKDMRVVPWTGDIIGLIFAFTAAMLILYTVAPMIYRMASSAYFNLSLLSSDFYGLLFGKQALPYLIKQRDPYTILSRPVPLREYHAAEHD